MKAYKLKKKLTVEEKMELKKKGNTVSEKERNLEQRGQI